METEIRCRCQSYWGFPHSLVGKESACNMGDPGSIPGLGRSPGEGNSNPLQFSFLAWRIPRTEDPGGLQSMGLQRVRHAWATNTHTQTVARHVLWDFPGKNLPLHVHTQRKGHVSPQGGHSCQQDKNKLLSDTKSLSTLSLGFPAPRTWRNKFLLFKWPHPGNSLVVE